MTHRDNATMDIVVNEGLNRTVYPGATWVEASKTLPEYKGGVTMTIRATPMESQPAAVPLTIDPNRHGGVPCVGAGCWPITHLLKSMASGVSPEMLIQQHSGLTLADIQMALDVAAWVMKEPTIDWQQLNLLDMVTLQDEMDAWQHLSYEAFEGSEEDSEH